MFKSLLFLLAGLLLGGLILRWRISTSIRRLADRTRHMRQGMEGADLKKLPEEGLFAPILEEINRLAENLKEARSAAAEEARLRLAGESRWTPERLREHVRTVLRGKPFLVIANREPYTHVWANGKIKLITPASGLVTAVEPILRACGGTWIASASGDADRETADPQGRLRVPPDAPVYTLRRVWLTEQEEEGYYDGFSNEGLWPLCHIAHTRPTFRVEDWHQYQKVNQRFADAALEELQGAENPFILIQDYHYALLARLIKEKRPDARIAIFWHIPWPNPESFGICPWARDVLEGMLGADLVGFHTQSHCNNFLHTADHLLESRIDWEQFAVNRAGHKTWVKAFPVGIAEMPQSSRTEGGEGDALDRERVQKTLGISVEWLGVGVDRIDYTKGIRERFGAIERFLEKYPDYVGRFTFIEMASPSRTGIKRYQDLGTELETEANRINQRFQTRAWKPILFLKEHHSREQVSLFYRAADLCLVTSLHDGMNLVAKEFVASRSNEKGVLILSQFAGASTELRDALLVNPYDMDEVADAIRHALTMPIQEQRERILRMHNVLRENNAYRWAADIVNELDRIRPDQPQTVR